MGLKKYKSSTPSKPSTLESIQRGLTSSRHSSRKGGRVHASSGGYCERRNVMHSAIPESETLGTTSPTLQLYASIGDAVHSALQTALFQDGSLLFAEYHLPEDRHIPEVNLGGYIDAIIFTDSRVKGLEIKTTSRLPESPKPQHIHQSRIYSAFTGLSMEMLYVSRNVESGDWRERGEIHQELFHLDYDRDESIDVMTTVIASNLAYQEDVMPPIPEGMFKSHCSGRYYCPFYDMCWPDYARGYEPNVDDEEWQELRSKARNLATRFVDDTPERRNGILKFIMRHGTKFARMSLYNRDWSELV